MSNMRRHPHGKFQPPRAGKVGINAEARKNCSMLWTDTFMAEETMALLRKQLKKDYLGLFN
jgi:hypothetical protein